MKYPEPDTPVLVRLIPKYDRGPIVMTFIGEDRWREDGVGMWLDRDVNKWIPVPQEIRDETTPEVEKLLEENAQLRKKVAELEERVRDFELGYEGFP